MYLILGRQMHDRMHKFACYLAKYEYLAVEDFESDSLFREVLPRLFVQFTSF